MKRRTALLPSRGGGSVKILLKSYLPRLFREDEDSLAGGEAVPNQIVLLPMLDWAN